MAIFGKVVYESPEAGILDGDIMTAEEFINDETITESFLGIYEALHDIKLRNMKGTLVPEILTEAEVGIFDRIKHALDGLFKKIVGVVNKFILEAGNFLVSTEKFIKLYERKVYNSPKVKFDALVYKRPLFIEEWKAAEATFRKYIESYTSDVIKDLVNGANDDSLKGRKQQEFEDIFNGVRAKLAGLKDGRSSELKDVHDFQSFLADKLIGEKKGRTFKHVVETRDILIKTSKDLEKFKVFKSNIQTLYNGARNNLKVLENSYRRDKDNAKVAAFASMFASQFQKIYSLMVSSLGTMRVCLFKYLNSIRAALLVGLKTTN